MLAIIIVWTKRNYKLAMLGVISKSVSQRIIKIAVVFTTKIIDKDLGLSVSILFGCIAERFQELNEVNAIGNILHRISIDSNPISHTRTIVGRSVNDPAIKHQNAMSQLPIVPEIYVKKLVYTCQSAG